MKICLCGSTRFKAEYEHANEYLTDQGHVVYTVSSFRRDMQLTPHQKENLDAVHLAKILNSDTIVVVGIGENGFPYVGDSTRREILWAEMNGKAVIYGLRDFGFSPKPETKKTQNQKMELQKKEFDAMGELAEQWRRLSMTPIVDDDYPEVRHDWEGALRDFIRAMQENGRPLA